MRERPIAAYDALPLASKIKAIQSEAAAARSQDEYTAAGERAIRLLPQIMQALEADRKHRAVPHGDREPATFLTHITANQAQALLEYFGGGSDLLELYRMTAGAVLDDDEPMPEGLYVISTNAREEGYTYLGDEDENAAQTFEEDAAPPAAQAVPEGMPVDLDGDEYVRGWLDSAIAELEHPPMLKLRKPS